MGKRTAQANICMRQARGAYTRCPHAAWLRGWPCTGLIPKPPTFQWQSPSYLHCSAAPATSLPLGPTRGLHQRIQPSPCPEHPDMGGMLSPITDILYEFFSFISNISFLPPFFRKEGQVIFLCLANDLLARSQLLSLSIQNGRQGWLTFSPQKDLYLMGSNPISTIIFLTKSTHKSDNRGAMFS